MHAKTSAVVPWAVLATALVYCAWLGWHWLPLDYSDGEFVGFVSRLWDVRRALLQQHALPWWTPYYLSGSSYGLHHSQGLYLLPSLLFSVFFDLLTSVKLTALLAVVAGTVAMYFCARHFLIENDATINQIFHRAVVRRDRSGSSLLRISLAKNQLLFCFFHLCTHDSVPFCFRVHQPLGADVGQAKA